MKITLFYINEYILEFYTDDKLYNMDKKKKNLPPSSQQKLLGSQLLQEYLRLKLEFPDCK